MQLTHWENQTPPSQRIRKSPLQHALENLVPGYSDPQKSEPDDEQREQRTHGRDCGSC